MSEQSKAVALIPYTDIEKMAGAISKSQLFGMKKPEEAIALMLLAQAQGRHPATVAMEYDIIQNRPALKSQAALMRFQEAGGKIEYITRTDAEVSARFSHPQGGTLTVTWNMNRARMMGLDTKDNWKKQPMIMLQWRVVAEGVRACYPACLGGSYLVEEVQDFDDPKKGEPKPPREINPVKETPAPATPDASLEGEVLSAEEAAEVFEGEVEQSHEMDKCAINGDIATGYVKNITVKANKTGGGSKYTVFIGEEKFGMFDKKLAEIAKQAQEDGKKIRIKFKTDSYGKFALTLTSGGMVE